VQTSFRLVEPILEKGTSIFYDRLFELDPSLRQLFRTSREEQERVLANTLTVVVKSLHRPELRGAIETLGRRHTGYGVRDEHYTTFGAALLWTLETGLGEAFTAEIRGAWTAVYGWLAFTMRRAAATRNDLDDTRPMLTMAAV
jgi:hemoglobin-like flavoprotein